MATRKQLLPQPAAARGPQPSVFYSCLVRLLYGESPSDESLVHAGFYAALMCTVVGVYWLMRSIKDSVFATLVGLEYQPTAKMLSLLVVMVILLLYNKAVDVLAARSVHRSLAAPRLFAAVFSCYAVVFCLAPPDSSNGGPCSARQRHGAPGGARWHGEEGRAGLGARGGRRGAGRPRPSATPPRRGPPRAQVAAGLNSTRIGLYGADGVPLPASPDRLLGWLLYFAIESYGSLSVSLFWQFINSQVGVRAAKAQYGIIVAGGQIGAIGGCTLVLGSKAIGVPRLCALGGLLALLPIVLLRHCSALGAAPAPTPAAPASVSRGAVRPGLFEGARLICTHRYVLAIFVSTSLYKVMATIMDFQLQVLVRKASATPDDYAAWMGLFGVATNTVSLVFSLLGTSYVLRTLGLTATLVLYPLCLGVVALAIFLKPGVWTMFHLQVVAKGLSYALQSPSREMLYIITSESIKFKAKSWIDVFGSHSAKALGSALNHACKHSFALLMNVGSLTALSIAVALALLGSWLGQSFERSSAAGEVIGEEGEAGVALVEGKGGALDDSCEEEEAGRHSAHARRERLALDADVLAPPDKRGNGRASD